MTTFADLPYLPCPIARSLKCNLRPLVVPVSQNFFHSGSSPAWTLTWRMTTSAWLGVPMTIQSIAPSARAAFRPKVRTCFDPDPASRKMRTNLEPKRTIGGTGTSEENERFQGRGLKKSLKNLSGKIKAKFCSNVLLDRARECYQTNRCIFLVKRKVTFIERTNEIISTENWRIQILSFEFKFLKACFKSDAHWKKKIEFNFENSFVSFELRLSKHFSSNKPNLKIKNNGMSSE